MKNAHAAPTAEVPKRHLGSSDGREKHAAEVKQLAPRRLFGFWQPGELGSGSSLEREGTD